MYSNCINTLSCISKSVMSYPYKKETWCQVKDVSQSPLCKAKITRLERSNRWRFKHKQVIFKLKFTTVQLRIYTVLFQPNVQSCVIAKKSAHPKCFSFDFSDFFWFNFVQILPHDWTLGRNSTVVKEITQKDEALVSSCTIWMAPAASIPSKMCTSS